MGLFDEISQFFLALPAVLTESKGMYTAEVTVAERKAFLSKKKLIYIAKFRIDEAKREVRFTETLKETGFGLGGGDMDDSNGVGYKIETGKITEQSTLFGKKYAYVFDPKTVREAIEKKIRAAGYVFTYKLTSIGV